MAQEQQTHYLALYRKYRPRTFEDVWGRDTIVRTLKNQIISGRIGHSYLFCGTRGTGKTTIAKIYARAVNCEHPADGSPCGECPSCQAIARDASLNVVEMDAASNNGVDDIRNIIDEVSYSPTQGRYRVYIIDEVHMLSTPAFNALLKTLEEPPSYAIFILATTEPNKLPITILSRCQRYDFGRLSAETIMGRLREVAQREDLTIEERALHYIAVAADGSMRDGLSLLDQCNAFNYGNDTLTYDKTLEILGAVDAGIFADLFEAVNQSRVREALEILDSILLQGRELVQFVTDFIWYLRNLMLLKASEETKDSLDVSAEHLERMLENARASELSAIMRYLRVMSALTEQIRYSSNRRILTEMALIRLCEPAMESDRDSLAERIRALERQLLSDEKILAELRQGGVFLGAEGSMNGAPNNAAFGGAAGGVGGMEDFAGEEPGRAGGRTPGSDAPGAAASPADGGAAPASRAGRQRPALPSAVPEDVRNIAGRWSALISGMPPGLEKVSLQRAQLSVGERGQLVIVFDNFISAEQFIAREQNRTWLQAYLAERTGKSVEIEYKSLDKGEKFSDNYVDLREVVRMNVEVQDIPPREEL
ncbi:MAG: DNA polymerase III subunit gamma/tau [Eubacteriales bacterium]|nr:DNA polymerase III subunit gamma/tau [Eubacteriales bacterium]